MNFCCYYFFENFILSIFYKLKHVCVLFVCCVWIELVVFRDYLMFNQGFFFFLNCKKIWQITMNMCVCMMYLMKIGYNYYHNENLLHKSSCKINEIHQRWMNAKKMGKKVEFDWIMVKMFFVFVCSRHCNERREKKI